MEHEGDYLAWLSARGFSERTLSHRKDALRRFWGFQRDRGVMREVEVRREDVEAYRGYVMGRLGERTGRPLKPRTVQGLLLPVKQYFGWLERRGLVLKSPAAELSWPRAGRGLPRVPSAAEMEAILRAPKATTRTGIRDRAILELMYSTGLRSGEVVRLDVYDVDLVGRTVRVREGKGGKDRVAPMGEAARECLARYVREVRPRLLEKRKEAGESGLFLVQQGGRRMSLQMLNMMIRHHTWKAVGRVVTGHKFRHAFATHMVAGGASIRLVQEMLGHARLRTTEIYTQVKPVALKEAHRRCHPRARKRD